MQRRNFKKRLAPIIPDFPVAAHLVPNPDPAPLNKGLKPLAPSHFFSRIIKNFGFKTPSFQDGFDGLELEWR